MGEVEAGEVSKRLEALIVDSRNIVVAEVQHLQVVHAKESVLLHMVDAVVVEVHLHIQVVKQMFECMGI